MRNSVGIPANDFTFNLIFIKDRNPTHNVGPQSKHKTFIQPDSTTTNLDKPKKFTVTAFLHQIFNILTYGYSFKS